MAQEISFRYNTTVSKDYISSAGGGAYVTDWDGDQIWDDHLVPIIVTNTPQLLNPGFLPCYAEFFNTSKTAHLIVGLQSAPEYGSAYEPFLFIPPGVSQPVFLYPWQTYYVVSDGDDINLLPKMLQY